MCAESSLNENVFEKRYVLRERLGCGGMGEVYSAYDAALNTIVAVKLIRRELSRDPRVQMKFYREARSLLMLSEPHIVDASDFGMTRAGQLYIAMERVSGVSLSELGKAPLPLSCIQNVVSQLLSALEHVHARGVIHRDVKSENVIVTLRDNALSSKLIDFGLAAMPSTDFASVPEKIAFGSPGYIAPEQIVVGMTQACPATDLYSVGVILYELITGKLPFYGTCDEEILAAQLRGDVRPLVWRSHLALTAPCVKLAFEALIQKAVARHIWERYLTASEFKNELLKIRVVQKRLPEGKWLDTLKKLALEERDRNSTGDLSSRLRALDAVEDAEAHHHAAFDVDEAAVDVEACSNSSSLPFGVCACEGREKVWKQLDGMAKNAILGIGRIVVIQGDFGVGKSFLVSRIARSWRTLNATIIHFSCIGEEFLDDIPDESQSAGFFYALITGILDDLAGIPQNADWDEKYTKRATCLKELNLLDDEVYAVFEHFVTHPFDIDDITPSARIVVKQPELVAAFVAHTISRPLFILIDDLQRCDRHVFEFLEVFRRSFDQMSALIVATYEATDVNALYPERVKLAQTPFCKELLADALTLQAVAESDISLAMKTTHNLTPELADRIAALSSGNLYYAMSCVEQLRVGMCLVKNEAGEFEFSSNDGDALPIPDSVCRYFNRRLDHIGRRLGLRYALYWEVLLRIAILGVSVNLDEVEVLFNHSTDRALKNCWMEAVAAWCEYGILRKEGEDGKTIRFYEAWLPMTIESFAPPGKTRELHRRVAHILQSSYPAPSPELLAKLANHWKDARDDIAFARAAERAARENRRCGNLVEAQNLYRALFNAWYRKKNALTDEKFANAIHWFSAFQDYGLNSLALCDERAIEEARAALFELAKQSEEKLAVAKLFEASIHLVRGKLDDALHEVNALTARAYFLTRDVNCDVRFMQARLFVAQGRNKDAVEMLENVCSEYSVTGKLDQAADAYALLSHALWRLGFVSRAHALQKQTYEALEKRGDLRRLKEIEAILARETCLEKPSPKIAHALEDTAQYFVNKGDVLQELTLFRARFLLAVSCDDLGLANKLLGRLRKLKRDYPQLELPSIQAWNRFNEAVAFMNDDLSFDAQHALDDAKSLFVSSSEKDSAGLIYILRAFVFLDSGDEDQAGMLMDKARELCGTSPWLDFTWELMNASRFVLQKSYDLAVEKARSALERALGLCAPVFISASQLVGIEAAVMANDQTALEQFVTNYKPFAFPPKLASPFTRILERLHRKVRTLPQPLQTQLAFVFADEAPHEDESPRPPSFEIDLEPQRFMPSIDFNLS